MLIGVGLVLGLMLWARVHAFLALLVAALAVTLLSGQGVAALLESFGRTAGAVGVVIALAAVIGQCLLLSGAADRIVGANVRLLGERRAAAGLMAGGYVLAVPVFFDTVFYLLIPLARKLHRRTGLGYGLCLMALAGGAAATHALVPPTPGPLLVAATLGVSVGQALAVGVAVSVPACVISYAFAKRLDRWTPLVMTLTEAERAEAEPAEAARTRAGGVADGSDASRPTNPAAAAVASLGTGAAESPASPALRRPLGLSASLLPIVLPIVLIGAEEVRKALAGTGDATKGVLAQALPILGAPAVALGIATAASILLLVRSGGLGARKLSGVIEESLMSAGVIILITAAGGSFGAALKGTGIAEVIAATVDLGAAQAQLLLLGAFALASVLKVAQGSSTVAMIVASGMLVAAVDVSALTIAPAFLSLAVCSGSLVGSWMNDSGFWIFSKMGGLTERETLRTWTPMFGMVGAVAFAMTLLLSVVF